MNLLVGWLLVGITSKRLPFFSGRRLLLPGESRNNYQPLDSGYGQPPPPQYGPSVDNHYIPGTGVINNFYR